jgi:hypothetical protein
VIRLKVTVSIWDFDHHTELGAWANIEITPGGSRPDRAKHKEIKEKLVDAAHQVVPQPHIGVFELPDVDVKTYRQIPPSVCERSGVELFAHVTHSKRFCQTDHTRPMRL